MDYSPSGPFDTLPIYCTTESPARCRPDDWRGCSVGCLAGCRGGAKREKTESTRKPTGTWLGIWLADRFFI